jgi:hypothetical protein
MISFAIIHARMTGSKASPFHPVRNHLRTLDGVDVASTIREAFKR